MKEGKDGWLTFLKSLKARSVKGVRLFVGDKCLGLSEAVKCCSGFESIGHMIQVNTLHRNRNSDTCRK